MNTKKLLLATILLLLFLSGVKYLVSNFHTDGVDNRYHKLRAAIDELDRAYREHKQSDKVHSNFTSVDILETLNYYQKDSSRKIDDVEGYDWIDCSNKKNTCFVFHGGSVIASKENELIEPERLHNVVQFFFDPDGKYSGKKIIEKDNFTESKAIPIFLFQDGAIMFKEHAYERLNLEHPSTGSPTWLKETEYYKSSIMLNE